MTYVELHPFRFRDPLTGKWVRGRYKATLEELKARYAEFEVTGPMEVRDGDGAMFHPYAQTAPRRAEPVDLKPVLNVTEAWLAQMFLRRYVTLCARRRRFAAMQGAARLYGEIRR